jgi:ligand-binding sensor domain-containing protein
MNFRWLVLIAVYFVGWRLASAQTWTWNTVPTSQLVSNAQGVTAICRGQADEIWLGTDAGLVLYSNQQFNVVSNLAGKFVRCLLWDSLNTTLWVGTDGAGLFSNSGNVWTQVFPESQVGSSETRIQSLVLHQGNLWVGGAEKGLFKWDAGSWQQFNALTTAGQLPFSSVNALVSAASGLWVATQTNGLYRLFDQGGFTYLTVDSGLPANHVQSLHYDESYVWIGHSGTQSNNHLARYHVGQKSIEVFEPASGFPAFRQVYAFAEDSSGRLWIGSHMSDFPLAYFDGQSFTGIPEFNSGFIPSPVKSLMVDAEQSVWVGHFGGISVNTLLPTFIEPSDVPNPLRPYPNPFSDQIQLPNQSSSTAWELLNLQGELLGRGQGKRISGAGLARGIYVLRYLDESGKPVSALIYRTND